MEEQTYVGERIKHLRQEKLMTQADLAGARMTRSMLSLLEHGNSEPSLSTLRYLASRLRVSPAFLLADADELEAFRRDKQMRELRIAYAMKEYQICRDICLSAESADDELLLLLAECSIALAVECITSGTLHAVGELLESAISAAAQTKYQTAHIYAEAAMLSRYLRRFSETFDSDAEDEARSRGISFYASAGNPFCLYAILLFAIEGAEQPIPAMRSRIEGEFATLAMSSPPLVEHLEAVLLFREARFEEASAAFGRLLYSGDPLPKPVVYEIYRDREACCRELSDYDGVYEAVRAQNDLLAQLLSAH